MNVVFRCPQCDQTAAATLPTDAHHITCPRCQASSPVAAGAIAADGHLERCLVCPSTELFVRKDFSQSLGVVIVVAGIIVSSIFWAYHMPYWTYGVLFTTAIIDVVLYLTVGNMLQCYRCQAQYRGVPGLEDHGGFDLETHEKHRQQRIRMAQSANSAQMTKHQ